MKKIKILCTICARKGSKGLKNKNLLKLLDKPLIMHTIEQARMIKYFNKIIVSSDSKKIIEISKIKLIIVYYDLRNCLMTNPQRLMRFSMHF